MRVIAGRAKGRRLKSPTGPGTRPVMDRVKTALFDILMPVIEDATFLDLFAGTGGIGIEALSRGAAHATFVELDAAAFALVRENLRHTELEADAETIRGDAFQFLTVAARVGRTFDIVYVAPPQYVGMAARALGQLDTAPVSAPGGLVIVQIHPKERREIEAIALSTLELVDERTYGSTLLLFYEHRQAPNDHRTE